MKQRVASLVVTRIQSTLWSHISYCWLCISRYVLIGGHECSPLDGLAGQAKFGILSYDWHMGSYVIIIRNVLLEYT